ncbi:hypothetical protein ACFLS1_08500 [Verrucomicrobiota bacterium]
MKKAGLVLLAILIVGFFGCRSSYVEVEVAQKKQFYSEKELSNLAPLLSDLGLSYLNNTNLYKVESSKGWMSCYKINVHPSLYVGVFIGEDGVLETFYKTTPGMEKKITPAPKNDEEARRIIIKQLEFLGLKESEKKAKGVCQIARIAYYPLKDGENNPPVVLFGYIGEEPVDIVDVEAMKTEDPKASRMFLRKKDSWTARIVKNMPPYSWYPGWRVVTIRAYNTCFEGYSYTFLIKDDDWSWQLNCEDGIENIDEVMRDYPITLGDFKKTDKVKKFLAPIVEMYNAAYAYIASESLFKDTEQKKKLWLKDNQPNYSKILESMLKDPVVEQSGKEYKITFNIIQRDGSIEEWRVFVLYNNKVSIKDIKRKILYPDDTVAPKNFYYIGHNPSWPR